MPRPPPQAPPPTDKGWAWVVAIAIFFERFFTIGLTRSLGLFLIRLVDRYHVTNTYASMAMTLAFSIFAIGAPVATVLGESLTPRRLFILGGVFAVVTMTVSGLVVDKLPTVVIIVTVGLAVGVVNSCSYGNGMVMIGKYFREKRQMATNLALLGASVGQLILPPVLEYLIVFYGLSGALLLSGALYFQCAVSGALLRPIDLAYQRMGDDHHSPIEEAPPRSSHHHHHIDDDKGDDGIVIDDNWRSEVIEGRRTPQNGRVRAYKKLKSEDSTRSVTTSPQPKVQERTLSHVDERGSKSQTQPTVENPSPDNFVVPEIIIQNDKDEVFSLPRTSDWRNELYGGNRVNSRLTVESSRRKSEDISGKIPLKNGRRASFTGSADKSIVLTSGSSSLSASGADLYLSDSFDESGDDNDNDNDESPREGSDRSKRRRSRRSSSIHNVAKNQFPQKSKSIKSKSDSKSTSKTKTSSKLLGLVFDFSVVKDPVTILFISITFLFYTVWYSVVLLLPGIASEKGFTDYDKPLMISMIGFGDLVSRVAIATGSLLCCGESFLPAFQRYKLKAVAAFLGGVNILLFIPASSCTQLAVFSFLHGLFGGVFECMFPGVLTDFVGVAKMAKTLGVVLLVQGMGGAIGQPIMGGLKDLTESFHAVCAVCSGCLLTSCVLLLLYPVVRGKG